MHRFVRVSHRATLLDVGGLFCLMRRAGFCLQERCQGIAWSTCGGTVGAGEKISALALKEEQKENAFEKKRERTDHVSESV